MIDLLLNRSLRKKSDKSENKINHHVQLNLTFLNHVCTCKQSHPSSVQYAKFAPAPSNENDQQIESPSNRIMFLLSSILAHQYSGSNQDRKSPREMLQLDSPQFPNQWAMEKNNYRRDQNSYTDFRGEQEHKYLFLLVEFFDHISAGFNQSVPIHASIASEWDRDSQWSNSKHTRIHS